MTATTRFSGNVIIVRKRFLPVCTSQKWSNSWRTSWFQLPIVVASYCNTFYINFLFLSFSFRFSYWRVEWKFMIFHFAFAATIYNRDFIFIFTLVITCGLSYWLQSKWLCGFVFIAKIGSRKVQLLLWHRLIL